jgi:dienelactone hydrolase
LLKFGFVQHSLNAAQQHPFFYHAQKSTPHFPSGLVGARETFSYKRQADYRIQVISGVKHGFASRGDPENPQAACEL